MDYFYVGNWGNNVGLQDINIVLAYTKDKFSAKLIPQGELNMLGNLGISGIYLGDIKGTEMQGFLMALMPPSRGRAVICFIVAPVDQFNQTNIDHLKTLLRSVIFL